MCFDVLYKFIKAAVARRGSAPSIPQYLIDADVYHEAKLLGEDIDCNRIDISNTLYQLGQIRSKFTEIETYSKLRATFDLFSIDDQPITIFTLCNIIKAVPDDEESHANYSLGSTLFMKIATEIFNKKYKARLYKDVVESVMYKFKDETQKIPQLIQELL